MSTRKFFKSSRCNQPDYRSQIQQSIIGSLELSSDESESEFDEKRKQAKNQEKEEEEHLVQLPPDDDETENSDSSGFHSPEESLIDDYDWNTLNEEDFGRPFGSSTPNRDQLFLSSNSFQQSIDNNGQKINVWEEAMAKNENLRKWIENFNKEIQMVDETEIVVKKIGEGIQNDDDD